ncbi:hypothetical protein WJU23_01025 [Prosthecobacter sp. SYSU 5D2]|uniref:hypothetical protein n=1 Tax=Prosthecobacter sp. SYSU 5D2 TaxID=3134134 RepID=UPI0031FEF457
MLTLLPIGHVTAQTAYEPTLPASTEVQSAGYFPTITEDILLRGPSDSRSLGIGLGPDAAGGPDGRGQVASGLFRYYDNNPDFYQRNIDFFRPVNNVLGHFTPHDSFVLESQRLQHVSFSADASLNLFTRTFNPELAHVKLGMLYFDVLWVGSGVVYSDFKGDMPVTVNGDDDEDGWIAYVELGVRGLVRITDSIYFSVVANVIYLPFENKLGFALGNSGNSGIDFNFAYNDTIGEWEILLYNRFTGRPGLEIFVDSSSTAFDRAGRYSFGFLTDRSNDFFNENTALFGNTVGFAASRALFGNQWRLFFDIGHGDFWQTFDFDNHGTRDFLNLAMQYEGSSIPFAPRFSYGYVSNDGYRSLLHIFELQLTGRITENIDWAGSVGYATSTGDTSENDNFIWSLSLNHDLSRSTRHGVSMGENYFQNEFISDTRFARYLRYSLDQRITSRFNAGFFAQFSENETSTTDLFPTRDRMGMGLSLTYRPLDFTSINAFALYEQSDSDREVFDDSARWLYRIQLNQQLGHRLTGNVFYQYEEFRSDLTQFSEHVCGLSLRRYF